MKDYQKKYNDLSSQETKTVLDFFNKAYTAEELIDALNKDKSKPAFIELAEAIMLMRGRVGAFTEIDQLFQIQGFDRKMYSTIVSTLIKPPFSFETEKLKHVMWVHGSNLVIESPEEFGLISRKESGTRIAGKVVNLEDPRPLFNGSYVHFAIPTPTFSSGQRLSVRSVLLNFKSSHAENPPHSSPIIISELNVWDGHQKIASHSPRFNGTEHRFARFSVPSGHNVNWGIGVSIKLHIGFFGPVNPFWIEFASVGAEFVSRTGVVIATE